MVVLMLLFLFIFDYYMYKYRYVINFDVVFCNFYYMWFNCFLGKMFLCNVCKCGG